MAIFASWGIKERVREYFVWLLVLQTAVMGVFTALDFFLFFLFWELELVPMFFLISIWGTGRKEYSAMKFLIFTFGGSAFMLVGILALFYSTGTFDMTVLPDRIPAASARSARRSDIHSAVRRLRRQAPGLACPHLASRRSHRRADGRQRDACRCASKDGRIRHDPRVGDHVPPTSSSTLPSPLPSLA